MPDNDSTQRLDSEEILRASELRFRALADNIPQLAWMADSNGNIFWFNQRYYDYVGGTFDDISGSNSSNIIHPDHKDRVVAKYFEQVTLGIGWEDTFPMRRKDGEYRWFLSRAFPTRHENGEIALWFGANTDITDQRTAEQKLATALRREALLNKIGQGVLGTRNPNEIQAIAVNAIGSELDVDRAYFSMTDFRKNASWIGQDYRRADLPSVAGTYRYSDYKFDPAAYHPDGKTLILADFHSVEWPELFAEAMRTLRIRAAIKVPMYSEGKMVARLVVAMADSPRVWTDEEVSLVETVAVQTRAAIDSALLQEQEHRVAEQLQNALQPELPANVKNLNIAAYMRPALDEAALGGDFYDVFPLDEHLSALVIGDVSGKGLAAAQQLALIRNSLRTTLYLFKCPAKSASTLNDIVTGYNLISGFVTAFVAIYNSETNELTYCSCGHEPGLLWRAATGRIQRLEATGYPIGVETKSEYFEVIVQLHKGDRVLLHTDGLSESGPDRNNLLGTEGMEEIFRSSRSTTHVQAAAEEMVSQVLAKSNCEFRDDVAVLLAERR